VVCAIVDIGGSVGIEIERDMLVMSFLVMDVIVRILRGVNRQGRFLRAHAPRRQQRYELEAGVVRAREVRVSRRGSSFDEVGGWIAMMPVSGRALLGFIIGCVVERERTDLEVTVTLT